MFCIHIWQSLGAPHLYNLRNAIWSLFFIMSVDCTKVTWPGWWYHLCNSFIMHIHLTESEGPGTCRTWVVTSGLNFISRLQIVFKSCDTSNEVNCVIILSSINPHIHLLIYLFKLNLTNYTSDVAQSIFSLIGLQFLTVFENIQAAHDQK